MRGFASAGPGEGVVFGARRPGYPDSSVSQTVVADWIDFMRQQGIKRVCCLLDSKLEFYDDLLEDYRSAFGADRVCHTPIPDHQLVEREQFQNRIYPFLRDAAEAGEKTVVHCSAGMGRTGHVLVLWLVQYRGYTVEKAIRAVKGTGRNPLEAGSLSSIEQLIQEES